MAKGRKTGGRRKGSTNRATANAREAIALFVDGNAGRLQRWLDDVAKGVKGRDGKYIVNPDPQAAFEMFQSVIEYHVPKLARTELTGKDGGPVIVQSTPTDEAL
jgi:hypothetical protein